MKVSYRPSTVYSYETTIRKWLRGIWQNRELCAITKSDIHELIFETISADDATVATEVPESRVPAQKRKARFR